MMTVMMTMMMMMMMMMMAVIVTRCSPSGEKVVDSISSPASWLQILTIVDVDVDVMVMMMVNWR